MVDSTIHARPYRLAPVVDDEQPLGELAQRLPDWVALP